MARTPGIIAIPRADDAYTKCFYEALERCGVTVTAGIFAGRWLFEHSKRGDFVHLHWPSFLYAAPTRRETLLRFLRFALILALLRACGRRIVWTAHNLYPHDASRPSWVDRVARRFVVALSSQVFAHGPTAAAMVAQEFPGAADKLTEIPHGNWTGFYPDTCSRDAARDLLGIPRDTHLFLFVGLCKPYKNLHRLLEAFGRVDADAMLLIAGKFQDPAYLAEIERLASADPGRVRLRAAYVPDDGIQVLMNASDTVVLPYTEILTSGGTMLAMSFGRPVIAPAKAFLRDILNERTGVLYDPTDPDALEVALRRAMQLEFDRNEILRHAGRFTWEESARLFLAALRRSSGADCLPVDPRACASRSSARSMNRRSPATADPLD